MHRVIGIESWSFIKSWGGRMLSLEEEDGPVIRNRWKEQSALGNMLEQGRTNLGNPTGREEHGRCTGQDQHLWSTDTWHCFTSFGWIIFYCFSVYITLWSRMQENQIGIIFLKTLYAKCSTMHKNGGEKYNEPFYGSPDFVSSIPSPPPTPPPPHTQFLFVFRWKIF